MLNVKSEIRNIKFLIINPFGIGDVLFSTPLIEAIKAQAPDSYIGYVCNMRTAPMVAANPNISKVFVYEKDEYRRLWRGAKKQCVTGLLSLLKDVTKEKFDIVFDLSLAQEYGLFLWFARVKKRIGYNYKNRGIFLTDKIGLPYGYCDKHVADYYLDLLAPAGMYKPAAPALKLYIPDKDSREAEDLLRSNSVAPGEAFICVAPGAGASWGASSLRKQWPKEKFAKAAGALYDKQKIKIVLVGSQDEVSLCGYVHNAEKRCINLCGKTTLMTLAAVLKKARLLIANDGGPLHMAAACGTKTVSIFGPVDDKVYGPYPASAGHAVIKNESLECRPCYRNFKLPECDYYKCLEDIPVERVVEAAEELLKWPGARG